MRRTILTALIATTAALCVAIPASGATGPFFIKTLNHQSGKPVVCIKVSPDQVGSKVVQGDESKGDCRKMFFSRAGFVNGHPYGEIQTSAPLDLAATSDCSHVTLAKHGATGTIWVQYVTGSGVPQYIINRHCNAQFGGSTNCNAALSASGTPGSDWLIAKLGMNGFLQAVVWLQVTSPAGHRHVSAGC